MDSRSSYHPGQHVPYVVVCGSPGVPLFTLVREPRNVIKDPALRLNGRYYVTKMLLPALHRMLSLIPGCDVYDWFRETPRVMTYFHHAESQAVKVGWKDCL